MKKLLVLLSISTVSLIGFGSSVSALPKYCGTSAYDIQYRAIYEYPTGSYWQTQIAAYPDYYAAHNAFYQSKYGC